MAAEHRKTNMAIFLSIENFHFQMLYKGYTLYPIISMLYISFYITVTGEVQMEENAVQKN
jgi:hypothetical protein